MNVSECCHVVLYSDNNRDLVETDTVGIGPTCAPPPPPPPPPRRVRKGVTAERGGRLDLIRRHSCEKIN